jgi:acyl dehydratase
MKKRYLEDFLPGQDIELGSRSVGRDEIVEFATKYDPQPFHVDEEAAKQSIFGGLVASGWHTIAMVMRLFVDRIAANSASLGSPGIDEIRFLKPVRPGDTISARLVVLDVVPSRSKSDRGHMRSRWEVFNQNGEKILTMIGLGIYGRRPRDS